MENYNSLDRALILLSGGLDSAVSLAIEKERSSETAALAFDYRQKAAKSEIKAAKALAAYYGIDIRIVNLDWLGEISNSALNKEKETLEINEAALQNEYTEKETSQAVWVPDRNGLFINIAAAYAEALNFQKIIIGANKEEGRTFIDNSKEFIAAQNNALKYSVNKEIKVSAPLIDMAKTDIVLKGIELNLPFHLIYSCYAGGEKHCGKCASCLRLKSALKNLKKDDIIKTIFGGNYADAFYR